ncbi:MAG: hypothetical protein E6H09_13125 [Bacteroidetes bacterium]|nr:MAG: hypothetical protein E6H09_13125 [Bacteroidota bacterium]
MDKLIRPGRIIYAIGIMALGVLCFIMKDFIVGRPPAASWAANIPGKLAWAYVSGSLLILAGLAVIFNVRGGIASLLIGVIILLFSFVLRHLYEMIDWINAYKALALAGGSFIVAASFFQKGGNDQGTLAGNSKLIFTGCLFLSFFFIISGLAHFRFADFIKSGFIPAYIPFHPFWTYFCGICLLAGGIGLLIPGLRKWAALLSGIMIGGWFILLHTVRFANDTSNSSDRLGLCESFTFVGILFVLAGMLSKKQ